MSFQHIDGIVGFSFRDRVDSFIRAVSSIGEAGKLIATAIREHASATHAVADAIRRDNILIHPIVGQAAVETARRLRAASDACGICAQKRWPEYQADPTPAWWHDNHPCPASSIYLTDPPLSPWTLP